MPDGFDPHTELETIYTFKQSVMEMRKCSPIAEAKIKQIASLPLDHPAATPMEQLRACEMIMNRAWGKPHTNVHVTTDMMSRAQSRVVLQHNYRDDVQVQTIENET